MEDLIENGLNLSKLNQYMNNKFVDCAISPPFLLSKSHARLIEKSINAFELPDIFNIGEHWWLCSPGHTGNRTVIIHNDGFVDACGNYICNINGVRPAFNIGKSNSLYLKLGDKVKIANIPCTVVLIEDNKTTVLCDDYLFKSPFNKDPDKGNDYETSDIKQELESYFKDKELKVEVIKSQTLDEMLNEVGSKSENSNHSEETPNER